jgi:hypothetical protein
VAASRLRGKGAALRMVSSSRPFAGPPQRPSGESPGRQPARQQGPRVQVPTSAGQSHSSRLRNAGRPTRHTASRYPAAGPSRYRPPGTPPPATCTPGPQLAAQPTRSASATTPAATVTDAAIVRLSERHSEVAVTYLGNHVGGRLKSAIIALHRDKSGVPARSPRSRHG